MKTNQLKTGVILSYLTMGLGYIISLIYTPNMLRLLGQSEFGLYNLVSSVVSYLGVLSFGFTSAYMRYYSKFKASNSIEGVKKLNGMFVVIYTVIGLVAVIAGWVLVGNTDAIFGSKLTAQELAKSKILLSIMVLNIAISFPASVFGSHIMANEKYIFQKGLELIRTIVSPFAVLVVLLLGYKSVAMVIVTTAITISIELSNAIFCLKKLNMEFSFKSFDFSLMKEMMLFSSFIFINIITDQINWNTDKFILGRTKGTAEVAVYGLASQLNLHYLSLSAGISSVFVPRVNKMVAEFNDNVKLTELMTRIGRIQAIVLSLIFTGLIFFGKPFIRMWAGESYSDSYAIALFLIIPVTVPAIQNIGFEIQKAKNMHQFRSWTYFFIAAANILISIPLAKRYGGAGAAAGTALALIMGNGIAMNWYYHVKIGLNMKHFWCAVSKLLPAVFLAALVGTAIVTLFKINSFSSLFLFGFLYTAVFCGSMWFLGMNEYEKGLFGNIRPKMLKKQR